MKKETFERATHISGMVAGIASAVRDETNEVIGTRDHVEIVRHYNYLRQVVATIKEAREVLDELAEKLSHEQIPDVFREKGIKTTTIEGIGRVTVAHKYSCSMVDKEAGLDWLRGTGNGGIIIETVNSSTLAAFAKSKVEEGEELPGDVFSVGTRPYTSITKVS